MASSISAGTTSSTALVATADTTGALELKTNNGTVAVTIDTSQNATFAGYANLPNTFGFKNRIINGAMVIDQRNAGASVTPTANAYTLDRWSYETTNSSIVSIQQNAGSVTPPAGFANYLGITTLSAFTITTNSAFQLRQFIEGFNIADLAWGTANAATVTLSFRVYSSLTGTFGGSLRNAGSNRSYAYTYTISSANTWTTISVTIPGDTSGTWDTTINRGICVFFGLGVGSNTSGTAGAWASANYTSATGAVNVVSTLGATFYITGVQLEKGSTATSFDYRPYGTELALCQRYFEKSFAVETAPANGVYSMGYISYVCFADQWVLAAPTILFKVNKRASPTIAFYGTSTNTWQLNDNSNVWQNQAATGTGFQGAIGTFTTGFSAGVHNNGNSGYAIGTARMIRGDWTASAEL